MPLDVTCECGRSFQAKDEHAGRRAKCSFCGAALVIPALPAPIADIPDNDPSVDGDGDGVARLLSDIRGLLKAMHETIQQQASESPSVNPGRKQYKVLTQKDKWFSGKFDPERIEEALNAYSGQGWAVRGITTASIPGFGGAREELIILLER